MSEIIAYFTARPDLIEYILGGILVVIALSAHWKVATLNDERLIRKYGSYNNIPEDEKFPPIGY